jgi:hypothetical protein
MTDSRDDQFFTLEDVVEALRSPARADELQDEDEVVAAMAAAILDRPKELAPVTTTRSRPLKVAVIAGAAVVSLAGVAAATGALPDRAPKPPPGPTIVTSTVTSRGAAAAAGASTSVVSLPTTSVAAGTRATGAATAASRPTTTDAVASAAAARGLDPQKCPRDVDNHGDFVSDVAQAVPPGPNHGSIVSEAAQSVCGKPDAAQAGSQQRKDEPPAASKGNGNGNANGKPNANGNGNANRHSNDHVNANGNAKSNGNGNAHGNSGGNGHP